MVLDDICQTINDAATSVTGEDVRPALLALEELRVKMMKVDMRLNDCQVILQGFYSEQLKQESGQEQPEIQKTPDLNVIQQELQKVTADIE